MKGPLLSPFRMISRQSRESSAVVLRSPCQKPTTQETPMLSNPWPTAAEARANIEA